MERRAQTDTELVEASRRGEREAFGHLVERYQDVVCAVSYSNTRDWSLSEDVAQDTFIAAWRSLGKLRETGRIRPWLIGIARNLARKASKRRDREEVVDDDLPATGGSPFEHTARGESERVVRDALARVPETYREVLVLYYGENRSVREVADALAISEAAALQRLTRGRRYLADGVTELVERSLRGSHVRRNLVPGVLAAVTAIGAASSRVDASPTAKGSTMLKVAIAAVTLAAAGTTAAVVHHNRTETQVASAAPIAAPAPAPVHAAPAVPHIAGAPTPMFVDDNGKLAPLPPNAIRAPEPDVNPTVSHEQIEKLGLYRGPARGPDHAKVTIVVFQDSMCKYCGMVLGTIDQLWDEYPGKLRLVIKQFPVHPPAKLAGEAMYAAETQGKFWEMHDMLLAHQDEQSHDALIQYAQQIGLDVAKFTTALDTHAFAAQVTADQDAGKAIDVNGTPSFLINGRKFTGARPIEAFRASIDAALQD